MTALTDGLVGRAISWGETDPRVLGLVLYGSAAQGRTHATSDVDLVVVTEAGCRDELWAERAEIASELLGEPATWSHDLPWQGEYRYQAWRTDLLGADLTFDESLLEDHETFRDAQPIVIAGDLALPPVTDDDPRAKTSSLAMETWIWFLGIHNQLEQERNWDAYCQLVQLLDSRVRPLLDDASTVNAMVPAAATRTAVHTALQAAVRAYVAATKGTEVGRAPILAQSIRDLVLRTPGYAS